MSCVTKNWKEENIQAEEIADVKCLGDGPFEEWWAPRREAGNGNPDNVH